MIPEFVSHRIQRETGQIVRQLEEALEERNGCAGTRDTEILDDVRASLRAAFERVAQLAHDAATPWEAPSP